MQGRTPYLVCRASRVLNGLQSWRIGAGVRRKKERDERKKSSYRKMRFFRAQLCQVAFFVLNCFSRDFGPFEELDRLRCFLIPHRWRGMYPLPPATTPQEVRKL